MSGQYNYGFRPPHGQSPLSPETPTSAYKTNLGRKKTKKWVEAKAQNYDGDDWGNDFDDEEPEEPMPVPPLKPASRQSSPSQATAANLPSNLPSHQPPTPQSAGLPTMRPPQPAVNESGLSTSPRATAGLPPLQIHTASSPAPAPARSEPQVAKPAIVSGPSSMDSVSDKGPYEQLVSPQSASTGPTPEPSLGRNEQPQSVVPPTGGRRTSPAPAQPQSTRFPPRKSSMGQHDSDRLPSSRSSSTHPPWVEQRARSPSGITSPSASSNSKPSFVRPSDIYRRVDSEKDRDPGSLESGRPSLDSSGGPKTDRSLSPAKPPPADTRAGEQASGSSLGKLEGEDAAQGNLRAVLAPVAERKSEYGFNNVLVRPSNHAQNQTMPSSSETPNLAILAPVPEPQIARPSDEEVAQQRRYSSSPRLPDLARMSLFGDDFFSNPDKFADDAPPMPTLTPHLQAIATAAGVAPPSAENSPAAPVALSTGSLTPQRADSPQVPEQLQKASTPPAQAPRDKENIDPAKSDLASLPSRPSLPGSWVTETRSIADEQTPPAVREKKTLGVDPGEVSPISDNEHDEVPSSGVAASKDVASMPVPMSNVSGQSMPSTIQSNEDSHSAGAPVHPLPPLNAGHSDPSSSSFVAPERLQRESTMSTVTSPSPVKESDKLREEIMRSLSPVRPTSDFNNFSGNRAAQPEEDTGPRESTYLHGVYDDYWTAGDDKPDVPELPAKQPGLDVHSVAKHDVSDVPPLSPRKENAGTPPTLGRRFSWEAEAESEQVTPGPGDSQEKPVADSQPQAAPVAPICSISPALEHEQSPKLSSEETREAEQPQPSTSTMDETHIALPTTSGTMSHQVSQVSSVPRDRLDSENIGPPSPVSAVTDKNNASAAPTRRLSLAEEKSMVRVSSNPVSPSPPPGEHPALARSSGATSPPSPAPAEPSQDQPATPLKIINFKEIMEIQTASERINKYNETRAQFASMDSGLNNWLVNLKSQHPEHANATASFAANVSHVGQPQSSPTASQPNSQQPYYQQYLNASSTNVSAAAATATSSGRPPAGSVSMGSHSPGSDFKHSSGQVGAKGKGLLLAAGKAGKGLLSKGKNKLRGTGDKRESSPPPVQPQSKAKPERRTSWGISLGTRSSPRAASHAHSRSFSGSLSGPAPDPQTIPEHPASRTPPPQLPQTSRISPLDALTQEKQASAWAPPRPQTPKHAAGVHRDSESEPVSPVSDTQSISAPNHHDNADDGDAFVNGTGDLQVPRPIGKTQPSWDPFTGTPLVEEEGFEMGQFRDPSPHIQHAPHAAPAAQLQDASTANATSDDDWVVVSPQSAPFEQVLVLSPQSPQLVPSSQPTESSGEIFDNEDESDIAAGDNAYSDRQEASQQGQDRLHHQTQHQVLQQDQKTQQQNQLQTRQQLPSQQPSVSPQRQSSFVGLPPIRRSSTFGINLTKRAKKRFSLEEDDDVDGQLIVSSPVSTVTTSQAMTDAGTTSLHQHVDRNASNRFVQPARIETGLSASRKNSAISHHVISATSTQAATLATESTGVAWGDDEKRALDPRHSFRPGGSTPHPIDTKLAMQQAGRTGGGPGMRSQQGVVSPSIGGNPIQHLPPQGPWKLEESHLSEPLLPASRNRLSGSPASPHQPYFGFDKETGVPSPTVPRQETQLPPRQRFSEVPPSSAQRYPGLFTPPPQGQPGLVPPVGPRSSYDLGHQFFPRDSSSIQRTHTTDSEVSSVEPSGDDERGRKSRSSGFFKELGERFSRPSSKERQNFKEDEVDHVGYPASSTDKTRNPVTNTAAGENQSERQKRRSSLFITLRGAKPSETGSQQGQEGEAVTPSPKASPNPASAQFQLLAGPAERKRSWLGSAANDSFAALPTLSRSSTSTAGNDQAGGAKAPLKKRFSGFAGKVFNRTSSQQELQPPQKPGTSHSLASSFQSHHSGAPATQLDVSTSQVAAGRERSNTTGSGPFGLLQSMHLQTVGEEDRGRRSSAGNLLSGIFGHRSSRNQEAQFSPQAIFYRNNHAPSQPSLPQPANQHSSSNPGLNRHIGPPPTVNQQFGSDQQQLSLQSLAAYSGRSVEAQQQIRLGEARSASSVKMAAQPSHIVPPFQKALQNHDVAIVEASHAPGIVADTGGEADGSSRGALDTTQLWKMPGSHLDMSDPSTQQPSARQNQAAGSHVPRGSDSQAHALRIQGLDDSEEKPEHALSLRGVPDAMVSSSNGVVHAPETLQSSSISASPQPPPVFPRQPLVSAVASSTYEAPLTDRYQVRPVETGPQGVGQNEDMSQQTPSFVTQMGRQQAPELGHGSLEQFSQADNIQTQRSSLPQFSNQSQQSVAQGLDDQGQQSSVSKWFKNRTSAQPSQLSSHSGHPKESTTKSLFSAFKRSSKQPEVRSKQQQQQQQQPQQPQHLPPPDRGPHAQPFQARPGQTMTPPPGPLNQRNPHPMQGPFAHQQQRRPSPAASFGQRPPPQQSMSSASSEISQGTGRVLQYHRPSGDPIMTRAVPASLGPTPNMPHPQPYQEPQYDQVPIPRGYEAVHGEGHVVPSPYDIGRPSPPAQHPHHQMQPIQHSCARPPPPFSHRHPSEVSKHNQSQALAPKDQPQAPSQYTTTYQADRRVSTTSYQSTVSHTSYGAQPGVISTNYGVQEHNQQPQLQQDPRAGYLSDSQSNHTANVEQTPHAYAQGHPHLQVHSRQTDVQENNHAKSHVNSQVQQPSHADTHRNFAVRQSVDSPHVQSSHGGGFQPLGTENTRTDQSRHNASAEQLSSDPPQTQMPLPGLAVDVASLVGKGPHDISPDLRVMSDAGIVNNQPEGAGTRLSVNIQKANQDTSDSDIYDATPRLPSGPLPPPAKPIMATSTGQSQVSESSADEAPRKATHANSNLEEAGAAALARGRSTRVELEDTEDERMRTMRLEAQEEKILVDPYEEKQSSGNKYRKEDDPEAPQMSATSYPGQEWNPYGSGGYEEWD